ncbi:immunity 52 family protein [Corallococcus sp. AB049A]|uniref:immunity 52 family protein n=1 Tax=Corallococcus sp. AB049A TaxID=2316721 RepID=UPI0018F47682|nr:immunity 52 family protein [Corallococcus sp. AB049A]
MSTADRMTDSYYLGAYWTARHESDESCATRASNLFDELGRVEPTWRQWHETGRTFKQAQKRRIQTDQASFLELFAKKKNRIGDGFQYWFWAGPHPDETTSVNGFCGSADAVPTSVCVIDPPSQGEVAERVLTAPVMREVLRSVVRCWAPAWGVVASQEYRDQASESGMAGTFVGWMTYFSRQWGAVPPLPSTVRVEPVEELGTLVILTEERFSVANPEHVRLATEVHQVLDAAGLLRPL